MTSEPLRCVRCTAMRSCDYYDVLEGTTARMRRVPVCKDCKKAYENNRGYALKKIKEE